MINRETAPGDYDDPKALSPVRIGKAMASVSFRSVIPMPGPAEGEVLVAIALPPARSAAGDSIGLVPGRWRFMHNPHTTTLMILKWGKKLSVRNLALQNRVCRVSETRVDKIIHPSKSPCSGRFRRFAGVLGWKNVLREAATPCEFRKQT